MVHPLRTYAVILAGWTVGIVVAFSGRGCVNRCPRGAICPAVCITGTSPLRLTVGGLVALISTGLGVWLWKRDRSNRARQAADAQGDKATT
jgi:hypothetical protein